MDVVNSRAAAFEDRVAAAASLPPEECLYLVLSGTLGVPFTEGNRITVLKNGHEIFPALLTAIRSARASINFLTFIYWHGEIAEVMAEALAERARAGVRVRVLLDAFGAWSMSRDLIRMMRAAGVEVVWFRPLLGWRVWRVNHRTHRKVLVVDGQVAFTGGVGVGREWQGDARNPQEWRDTHFRIEGPAVHGLQGAFFSNWAETGASLAQVPDEIRPLATPGEVSVQVLRTTATMGRSDIATVLQLLIVLARRRLRITTAYFVPDAATIDLLCQARRRGVEVEVMSPGPHIDMRLARLAGRSTYRELLDAGIQVWEYQPTMLHAKVVTVDGVLALLGSANFNQRSMRRDDEVSMVIINPDIVATLDRHFDEDRARCERIRLSRWRRRGWRPRLRQALAWLFSDNM